MGSVLLHEGRAPDPQLLEGGERPEVVDVTPSRDLGHVDVEGDEAGEARGPVGDGGHVGDGALGEGEAGQARTLGPQVALHIAE